MSSTSYTSLNSTFSESDRIIASVSQISGYLSLCVWLFAQLPQIIENHLNQSVSGVSFLFLSCWMGGDLTNLVGCLLTGALPFQTLLASYYCFIDCILALQYWYYTRVYPYQRVHHNMLQSPNMMRPQLGGFHSSDNDVIPLRTNRFKQLSPHHTTRSPMTIEQQQQLEFSMERLRVPESSSFTQKLIGALFVGGSKGANGYPLGAAEVPAVAPKRSVAEIIYDICDWGFQVCISVSRFILHIHKEDIGRFLAWTCSALYVSSRTPQIIENYRKKSTKGISIYLFIFAMLGNSLYTICIVTDLYLIYYDNGYMDEWAFRDALYSQLPFIVGSSGTVTFDCIILFQCYLYSNNNSSTSRKNSVPTQSQQILDDLDRYDDEDEDDYKKSMNRYNQKHRLSMDHFKKPDWYTNNNLGAAAPASGNEDLSYKRHAYRPSDSGSLLLSGQHSTYSSIASPPPPSHYITGSFKRDQTNGNLISNTFQSLSNSFRNAPAMATAIQTRSPNSGASSLNYNSGNSPLSTSLIPLIIGTYSSVSKKMKNEAKVPFLPIDFLHDDFHSQQQEFQRLTYEESRRYSMNEG